MKFADIIKNPTLRKVVGIGGIVFAGIAAMADKIENNRKEQEFEDMKKTLEELKSQEK